MPGRIAIPDHDGMRYCKSCSCFQPVSAFLQNRKTYECKAHVNALLRSYAEKRATPETKTVASIWKRCHQDKRLFHQPKLSIVQAGIFQKFEELQMKPRLDMALMPLDPCKELSLENSIMVTMKQRIAILKTWSEHEDLGMYRHLILDKNIDVHWLIKFYIVHRPCCVHMHLVYQCIMKLIQWVANEWITFWFGWRAWICI